MLTVPRFQLALNHENPDIVIKGLEAFVERVVSEHGAGATFGYHGHNGGSVEKQLYPDHPAAVVGLLGQYLQSSPQVEELFVLWNLPGRDENKALCAVQSECIAVILHCTHQYPDLGKSIVSRMLRENAKSLHMQLISGNTALVHSTLGLIIEMCRSSSQSAKDTFQKVMINASSLASLVQKGKTVNYTAPSGTKLVTDNRHLMTLFLLTALRSGDPELLVEIFGSNSLLRKVAYNLSKDTLSIVQLVLEGVLCIFQNMHISPKIKHVIIDIGFLKCAIQLYSSEDPDIVECAHRFLVNIVSSNVLASTISMGLATELEGHVNLKHREVQDVILRKHPQLVSKCLAAVSFSSQDASKPSLMLLSSLSQCVHLLDTVDVDGNSRQEFKSVVAKGNDAEMRRLAHTIVTQMIPNGLHKSAFSRFLLSSNSFVQHLSLLLCIAIYRRLLRIAGTVGRSPSKFHSILALEIASSLPDLDVFVNVRSRCMKRLDEDANSKDKQMHILLLCLRAIRSYFEITPLSLSGSNFDVVKLFDDTVSWPNDSTQPSELSNVDLVSEALDILSLPGVSPYSRWFGTKDDVSKLLVHYMVASDWTVGIKRSSLQKLLWITLNSPGENVNENMESLGDKGRKLFEQILKNSNLFVGHGSHDIEMRLELYSLMHLWKSSAQQQLMHTVIIADLCIKLGYHFNPELCLYGDKNEKIGFRMRPSAVTLSALHLSSMNLSVFEPILPKPIRAQLSGPSADISDASKPGANIFLQKFEAGLIGAMKHFSFTLCVRLVNNSWDLERSAEGLLLLLSDIAPTAVSSSAKANWLRSNIHLFVYSNTVEANGMLIDAAHQLILDAKHLISCDVHTISVYLYIRAKLQLPLSAHMSTALTTTLTETESLITNAAVSSELKLIACIAACKLISRSVEWKSEDPELWIPILCKATALAVEVLRVTNGLVSVYECLFKCAIGALYCDESGVNFYQRHCAVQILLSGAILNAKRSKSAVSNKSTAYVKNLHPLWQQVVAHLEAKCEQGREDIVGDELALGWAVQSFANAPSLRRQFIERASFSAGSGLLELTIPVNGSKSSLMVPMDSIAVLTLQSSSLESISKFFDSSYGNQEAALESARANAFMGDAAIVSTRSNSTLDASDGLRTISYFCDPLCLVAAVKGNEHVRKLNINNVYSADDESAVDSVIAFQNILAISRGAFDKVTNLELRKFVNSFPLSSILNCVKDFDIDQFPDVKLKANMLKHSSAFSEIQQHFIDLIRHLVSSALMASEDSESLASLVKCIDALFDHCGAAIKASFKAAGSEEWTENESLDFYFSLFFELSSITSDVEANLVCNSEKFADHLNNVIKNTLRRGIGMKSAAKFVSDLVLSLNMNHQSFLSSALRGYDASGALWNPVLLLELLLAHSKFRDALESDFSVMQSTDFDALTGPKNLAVLKLVLCLLNIISKGSLPSDEKYDSLRLLLQDLLIQLFAQYSGTMSVKDRILFRAIVLTDMVLQSENSDGRSAPELHLNFGRLLQQMPKELLPRLKMSGGAGLGLRSATEYITEAISQPRVYATLLSYPHSRPLIPPPIIGLEPFVENRFATDLRSIVVPDKPKPLAGADAEGDTSDGTDSDDESSVAVGGVVQDADDLSDAADNVYDPCFWGLVIRHFFNEGGVKYARHLANNGIMSLAIVMLGSLCPLARCVGYSSLQCIYNLCLSQTPDKDSTFRERPQILLLLDFIKNSMDTNQTGYSSLSGISSLFLSRSAMHVMQSGHELYGKINKYLLSRPSFDSKDVPLFDSVLASTDDNITVSEKLAALRLMRDGLLTREDHLNLCRKNAYGKLMVLFPFLSQDQRIGHAIFDLFERAISMPSAARYLIERCQIIPWMGQLLSLKTAASCPVKLLPRAVGLLRKSIAALVLLREHWVDKNDELHFNSVQICLRSVVHDYCFSDSKIASHVSTDFGLSIVSALWDLALACKSSIDLSWIDAELLLSLVRRLDCLETDNMESLTAVTGLAAVLKSYRGGSSSSELVCILTDVLIRQVSSGSTSGNKKNQAHIPLGDSLFCFVRRGLLYASQTKMDEYEHNSYLQSSPVAQILAKHSNSASNLWTEVRKIDVINKSATLSSVEAIASAVKATLRTCLCASSVLISKFSSDANASENDTFVGDVLMPLLRVALVMKKFIASEFSENWRDGFKSSLDSSRGDIVDIDSATDIDKMDSFAFLCQYRLSIIITMCALLGLHSNRMRFPSNLVNIACFNLTVALCKLHNLNVPIEDDAVNDRSGREQFLSSLLKTAIQHSNSSGTEWCYQNAPVSALVSLMNAVDLAARALVTSHDRMMASASSDFDPSLTEYTFDALSSVAAKARALPHPEPQVDESMTDSESEEEASGTREAMTRPRYSNVALSKYIMEQLAGFEFLSSRKAPKTVKVVSEHEEEHFDEPEVAEQDDDDENSSGASTRSVAEPSEIDSDEYSEVDSFAEDADDAIDSEEEIAELSEAEASIGGEDEAPTGGKRKLPVQNAGNKRIKH